MYGTMLKITAKVAIDTSEGVCEVVEVKLVIGGG